MVSKGVRCVEEEEACGLLIGEEYSGRLSVYISSLVEKAKRGKKEKKISRNTELLHYSKK